MNIRYSHCMFSVSALHSGVDPGVIVGGTGMAEEVLTTSEVLEIMYNSDKSLSDSSSDSVSSSDSEIDNIDVADAIISDESGDEEEILQGDFRWETVDNYTGHREVFSCDFGPRNGAKNVTLYNVLSCFLTKKSYNKLSEKLIGTPNNTRTPEAIFSHLDRWVMDTCHRK